MSYQTFTDADKINLVSIILETSDQAIDFDLFQELIGILSEDIPGLEFLSDDQLSSLTTECWEIYLASPVAPTAE